VPELEVNNPDYTIPCFEKKLFSMITDEVLYLLSLPFWWLVRACTLLLLDGHSIIHRTPSQPQPHQTPPPPKKHQQVKAKLATTPERKTIVLFGIEAHVCVQQTALDLLETGYEVHVLVDGVSSQRALDRAVALKVRLVDWSIGGLIDVDF
jgi:hypothetical protein